MNLLFRRSFTTASNLKHGKFPISVKRDVIWGDMDSFGHVNNVIFHRWIEIARIAYLTTVGAAVATTENGPIAAETCCTYLKPVTFPDNITIKCRASSLGNTSLNLEFLLESDKLGIVATGTNRVVFYNYKKGEKTSMPAAIRHAVQQLEAPRIVEEHKKPTLA